eukprot:TRINITY_DN44651_c0_g1_i1.p1 TRINITY_DN44651_c0_g1~~TRINITY_DN44651_c0_g1_i1.p1  ORF type:complete len:1109 (+),score=19.60 TRINITY_DN44651_c0_g1_i1:101-3427(+)
MEMQNPQNWALVHVPPQTVALPRSSDAVERCPTCLRPFVAAVPPFHSPEYWSTLRAFTHPRIGDTSDVDEIDADETAATAGEAAEPNSSAGPKSEGYYTRFFRERRKLGRGATGGVWLCEHVMLGVSVGVFAVKKIPVGTSPAFLHRVLSEVRLLASLPRSRHVVGYYHAWIEPGQSADFGPVVPCLFILMEAADRGALGSTIADLNLAHAVPPGVDGEREVHHEAASGAVRGRSGDDVLRTDVQRKPTASYAAAAAGRLVSAPCPPRALPSLGRAGSDVRHRASSPCTCRCHLGANDNAQPKICTHPRDCRNGSCEALIAQEPPVIPHVLQSMSPSAGAVPRVVLANRSKTSQTCASQPEKMARVKPCGRESHGNNGTTNNFTWNHARVVRGGCSCAHGGRWLPDDEVVWYIVSLLRGLHHLHRYGAIHRDVKLDNILLFSRCNCDVQSGGAHPNRNAPVDPLPSSDADCVNNVARKMSDATHPSVKATHDCRTPAEEALRGLSPAVRPMSHTRGGAPVDNVTINSNVSDALPLSPSCALVPMRSPNTSVHPTPDEAGPEHVPAAIQAGTALMTARWGETRTRRTDDLRDTTERNADSLPMEYESMRDPPAFSGLPPSTTDSTSTAAFREFAAGAVAVARAAQRRRAPPSGFGRSPPGRDRDVVMPYAPPWATTYDLSDQTAGLSSTAGALGSGRGDLLEGATGTPLPQGTSSPQGAEHALPIGPCRNVRSRGSTADVWLVASGGATSDPPAPATARSRVSHYTSPSSETTLAVRNPATSFPARAAAQDSFASSAMIGVKRPYAAVDTKELPAATSHLGNTADTSGLPDGTCVGGAATCSPQGSLTITSHQESFRTAARAHVSSRACVGPSTRCTRCNRLPRAAIGDLGTSILASSLAATRCDAAAAVGGEAFARVHMGATGTADYLAPELLGAVSGAPAAFSFSSDVWAAGVTLFVLLFGCTPWDLAACPHPRDQPPYRNPVDTDSASNARPSTSRGRSSGGDGSDVPCTRSRRLCTAGCEATRRGLPFTCTEPPVDDPRVVLQTIRDVAQKGAEVTIPPYPQRPHELVALCREMLRFHPLRRPSPAEILRRDWVQRAWKVLADER